MVNVGLIYEEMRSTLQLLEMVENKFSKEYKSLTIGGQRCFMSENGTVFYFVVLKPFRSMVVEYANNVEEAKAFLFEDGDQFDIDQSFEKLVNDIQMEILNEVA